MMSEEMSDDWDVIELRRAGIIDDESFELIQKRDQRIAELERHNALLRAVAVAAEWPNSVLCPLCDELKADGHLNTCPYKAAIDGGALDKPLPDCPNCGEDGNTVHHSDSTEDKPLLVCMKCGHIGEL